MTPQTDAEWFTDTVFQLFGSGEWIGQGYRNGQSALARFLVLAGDTRAHETILRNISNYAGGRAPIPPDLRVTLEALSDPVAVAAKGYQPPAELRPLFLAMRHPARAAMLVKAAKARASQ